MRSGLLVALLVIQSSHALSTRGIGKRDSKARLPFDENTTPHCTWWLDYEAEMSCTEILDDNYININTFTRWNPTVGANCDGMQLGHSYCVEAAFESAIPQPPPPKADTPAPPTLTKPSNGIETPLPIQPDMVSDCNKFYLVQDGDTCAAIATQHGISQADLATWNPKVGERCGGLWAATYACVSVLGHTPAPTGPSNGIRTPSPTQPGLPAHCVRFHYVQPGESCGALAARYGVTAADIVAWNPGAGRGCTGLWAGAYACVEVPAFRLTSRYRQNCQGAAHNENVMARGRDGVCVNTDCQVGSLDVAADGFCPDGQVQISYWGDAECRGSWFGYAYTSRGTCRNLWSQGWGFRSLHFRCMDSAEDCVNQNTCSYETEPKPGTC